MRKVHLLTHLKQEEYLLKITDKVFISFHCDEPNRFGANACAVIEESNFIDKEYLNELIHLVHLYLKVKTEHIICKVVAPELLADRVAKMIANFEPKELKVVHSMHGFELQFLPKEGRVRMLKSAIVDSVKIDTHLQHPAPVVEKKVDFNKARMKVLVVDDSLTIRNIMAKIIASDHSFECVGLVDHPNLVERAIIEKKPDIVTLDIHMPEKTGLDLLKEFNGKYKCTFVMVTSVNIHEGDIVLDCLENGAIDYIQKPSFDELKTIAPIMLEKLKHAFEAAHIDRTQIKVVKSVVKPEQIDMSKMIVIGSSTGGTDALKEVLFGLPDHIPPVLIVQHIPPVFSTALADRLNKLFKFTVKEASNGEQVVSDTVYIAPGAKQMKLLEKDGKYFIEVNDDDPVNRFKPSVDYFFESVHLCPVIHKKIIAVMLTGMGRDGADAMLKLNKSGAKTIAQNKESSVVFGMPKEAIKIGAVDHVCSLEDIPHKIIELCTRVKK